ncbi:hypothetical protein OEB99_13450 [Actinotalea sp. M2MS4P-6]|uniref:hypothetical protein n=1 Tax=Actinotalea sp. M2MS4P-6 TaxID=2983762 RepID=UPI0021E511A9|nr:hypothetical protein [Actinotalea sp. M2MS4P-6]MCV2395316.1 hypothetical protein [Actinotalea sp. M2MS4P-6]
MTSTRSRTVRAVALGAVLVLVLAACAASGNEYVGTSSEVRGTVGFWWGLWQGFIAPFAFIVSLFNDSVGIYEVHNNGGWYNFGYLIGLSAIFGGGGGGGCAARRRR